MIENLNLLGSYPRACEESRKEKEDKYFHYETPSPEISLADEKLSQKNLNQSLQSHPKFVSILMDTSSFLY